ncbi:Spo11/DNA topoisomerase VI subunit A, partial [Kickxella alabastrina]|uniref:Spo11/DNA topoisomerase VI subunit A n=1 Tax=Kickxella alabastrina TaxID=61397 RepID=UPI00221F3866
MSSLLKRIAGGSISPAALCSQILGVPAHLRKQRLHGKGLELCSIIEISYQLLAAGQVAYQRDVYYRHKKLLKSVENVRTLCNKLSFYFGVPPARLNIISCPKGLMYGHVSIELNNGCVLDFSKQGGNSLPHACFVQRITTVLIVEKETAFFALIQSGIQAKVPELLLVTGKGYPRLRIVVLVDNDPDGAHIFKCTPRPLAHAQWGGLHCSMARVGRWGLDIDRLIEFTPRDRSLALKLIEHWAGNQRLRRRMARMVYRGKKAELEVITQYRGMLVDF